jgi:hypothetical protein
MGRSRLDAGAALDNLGCAIQPALLRVSLHGAGVNYFLRVAIGFDAFVQSLFRVGVLGVTISARAGTGKAKGHTWACWLCDALDSRFGKLLGFGRDSVTGLGHCEGAIIGDRERANAVLDELRGY